MTNIFNVRSGAVFIDYYELTASFDSGDDGKVFLSARSVAGDGEREAYGFVTLEQLEQMRDGIDAFLKSREP